jgi:2-oxo-4-hydroxy-4-carboxy-5-ureidoimidazoline decarboxylase
MTGQPTLPAIDTPDRTAFVGALGFAFEDSPWVMERVFDARPFADIEALHRAAAGVLDHARHEERLALIRAHPRLADKVALAAGVGAHSASEQAGAGLDSLTAAEFERFAALNDAYDARFGFPFIICVRLNDKTSILDAMARRLGNTVNEEVAEAIAQILLIARLRLADAAAVTVRET